MPNCFTQSKNRSRRVGMPGGASGGGPGFLVRLLFLVLTPFFGAGILFYLWLSAFVPWAAGEDRASRRMPVAWLLAGAALLVFAGTAVGAPYSWAWGLSARAPGFWLVVIGLAAAAGCWASLVDTTDPARGPRHARIIRIVVTVLLALVFLTDLDGIQGSSARAFLVLLPIVAIAVIWSSPLITRWRELAGERIARIREEQRAEMAAHLHDSVLQTLALIQNRAGASSEVARIARAQERELRAWLYDGDSPADSDLSTDLRDFGGALELDYPVRIDVVAAGSSTERASGEVAAAAREAMLNAARHAGGEVSVYIEGSDTGVDVYVRDRGAGFDLDEVSADRLGVRESILGRMRRAGGTAAVRSDRSGTEVHLRYRGTGDVDG